MASAPGCVAEGIPARARCSDVFGTGKDKDGDAVNVLEEEHSWSSCAISSFDVSDSSNITPLPVFDSKKCLLYCDCVSPRGLGTIPYSSSLVRCGGKRWPLLLEVVPSEILRDGACVGATSSISSCGCWEEGWCGAWQRSFSNLIFVILSVDIVCCLLYNQKGGCERTLEVVKKWIVAV